MKTFAQTIELESEDAIEAYDALHARAWPEILESLRAVGVVDMFIYRSGVRLFMHMTTVDAFDPDVDFARHMAMSERCVEWGEVTRALQRPAPEAKAGEWWTRCRRVFDLRSQLDALDASRSRRV